MDEETKDELKNRIIRVLQLLGVAVLVFFFYRFDFGELWRSVQEIALLWIPFIILFGFVNIVIRSLTWRYIVQVVSDKKISSFFSMLSILAGISSGSIFPGRADIARPLILKTEYDISITESMSSMIIERIFYLISLLILFFISLSFFLRDYFVGFNFTLFISLSGCLIIPIVILAYFPEKIFLFLKKIILKTSISKKESIIKHLEYFLLSFKKLKNKKVVTIILFLSVSSVLVEALRMYWIFWLMNINVSLKIVAFSFFASMLLSLVSMVPGGIGIYETSQSVIIYKIDSSTEIETLKSAVVFVRLIYYYLIVLIGGVVLIFYKKNFIKMNGKPPSISCKIENSQYLEVK